jgi:hypothetical protein
MKSIYVKTPISSNALISRIVFIRRKICMMKGPYTPIGIG